MFEECADALPGGRDGSLGGFAEECFELGEDLLDGIEVWRVRRQEEELCADGRESGADGLSFMAAEIVHDDDVARLQGRDEELLDIGEEAATVDRAIDDARRIDAIGAERGEKGQCAPMAVRHLGNEAFASSAAPVGACHIGLHPRLIDEDEAGRIKPTLILPPPPSPARHIRPVLLRGVQAFF